MTVALAGFFVVGLWTLTRTTQQQDERVHDEAMLARADQALVAYAFQTGWLPCPATDTNGHAQSSCAPGATGYLPYRDLGLPDAGAGVTKYTVGTSDVNLTVDNSTQLQLLVGETDSLPSPHLGAPNAAGISMPAPYLGLCAVLTQSSEGTPVYALQMPTSVAGGTSALPRAADSSQTLNRSFAALSADMGCPAQVATSTRTLFNTVLSAQALLAGLNDYQQLLAVNLSAANYDLYNNALPASVSGPRKVYVKIKSLITATGDCAGQNPPTACPKVALAITDLITASVNEGLNLGALVRAAMNRGNAANFNYLWSQQIIAELVLKIGQIRSHAQGGIVDGIYL